MLLGDVIAGLEDETRAAEALMSLGDLSLVVRVQEAAARDGLSVGEFAAQAVQTFSHRASDEDWVSLIGVMGQTADPGRVCLKKMVEFALYPAGGPHACGHHG